MYKINGSKVEIIIVSDPTLQIFMGYDSRKFEIHLEQVTTYKD